MIRPPTRPRERPPIEQPTWQSLLVSYALVGVVPLLLWVVSQPLAGTLTLVGLAALLVGGRRAYRLIRCFYDCQGFTFDLGRTARITIRQVPTDEAN